MDYRNILHYAQKGVREALNDARSLQRVTQTPGNWASVLEDAEELLRECAANEVPIEPAFARALTQSRLAVGDPT
jgi:hypothetical protein